MPPSEINLLLDLIEKVCVITVVAYLVTRSKYFTQILEGTFTLKNQAILIIIFGAFSIYGSYSGIDIYGAIANVRDLGPMVGGLIGGPIVGLGAGLIGGLHRYSMGGFTCLPCSISTILAGLFAGIVFLLNHKKFIGIWGAVIFAVLIESMHMILALVLAQPFSQALKVVEQVTMPMILANAAGMFIFAFIITNLVKERKTRKERDEYRSKLERKKKELEIAHQIQESFLPHKIPSIENYDLAAISLPALEVGGDFYDFIPISSHQIGLTIGDVSGKGVPAALFMAFSRTLLRAKACRNPGVGRMIEGVNRFINEEPHSNMFVTLFYGVLDGEKNTLTYVNAGHNPPFLFNGKKNIFRKLITGGVVLGVIDEIELSEKVEHIEPGDLIVFYTDGVTEAEDEQKNQFREDRLEKIIKENYHLSSKKLIEKITQEVSKFAKGASQSDDITLIVLRRDN